MYTLKVVTNLTDPEAPAWQDLVESSFDGKLHPDRKLSFLLSREALRNALSLQGLMANIEDLKLVNYSKLDAFPQFTISLSHSKQHGAAVLADAKKFRSVGVDIEEKERVVKKMIHDRISHPRDINLKNIELWCVKEAVFKAMMNTETFLKPIEFSSIEIKNKSWHHAASGLSGSWELRNTTALIVAVALLRN